MSDQFENWQQGFETLSDFGTRLTQPVVDAGKVAVDSLSHLAEEQAKLGRSWVETCNQQLQSVGDADSLKDVFQGDGSAADYREAASAYGEAIKSNAEQTRETLTGIGRDAFKEWQSVAESMFGLFAKQGRAVYQQASDKFEEANEKVEAAVNKAA